MNILGIIDNGWARIEKVILSLTTILMSALLIGNALSRYFFNKSWAFTEEIGQLGIVVITFIGIGYAARKSMHIEMSGFYDLLSEKHQRILSIFINLISAIVLLVSTYFAFSYVIHLHELEQVTTVLRIPVYMTMSVVPIGFTLAFIRYFVDFVKGILYGIK